MAFVSNLYGAFRQVALQHGHRVALFYPATDEQVTYAELSRLADRIAAVFCSKGLRRGQVVAMFHDKSPAAFAAMLASLRLGIIYTNLDPGSPWERLRKIIGTCMPSLILNALQDMPFRRELDALGHHDVLNLRDMQTQAVHEPLPEIDAVGGGSAAYIMFTSGSTGMPKGAVMSHANLLWFIQWAQDRFGIVPDDVLTNVNPIYFDNSVFDFYSAIFSGATLVPMTPDQVQDTRLLVRLVAESRCTIWFSVPSLLVYILTTRALSENSFPSIRKIIFGGEGFPKAKLRQLYELFGARARLENVYGPTECTCICSANTIAEVDFEDMKNLASLGLLTPNFDYEILPLDAADPDFGELFLSGPQVGLGYFNDTERTKAAFIQNPRHSLYADIGYRTGDLVRKDAHGLLHFKGRADFQIKHMGYRIELEEIEAALNTLQEIRECGVVYHSLEGGLGQIVAFSSTTTPASSQNILQKISLLLPPYMIPRRVVILIDMPKNANGKIDRVALQKLASTLPMG